MTTQKFYVNPLTTMAELLRGLHQEFTHESLTGGPRGDISALMTADLGEALGALMGVVVACQDAAGAIEKLAARDYAAYCAFQRACERCS